MKKVLNWTIGSFFRTIGRTIALFVMAGIIYYLLASSGIDIKNLFLDSVNASTFANGVEVQYYKEEDLTNRWSSNNWYDYATLQTSTNIQSFNQVDFYPSPQINIQDIKKGYIEFTYYMSLPIVRNNVTSTIYGDDYCDTWKWGAIDSNNNVIRWDCNRVNDSQDSTITDSEYVHPVVNINAVIIYNNGYADYCSMDTANQKFVCPISNYAILTSIKFIRFSQNVYYSNSSQYTYYFGIMRRVNKYTDSASSIIDNQNNNTQSIIDNQQQQHEEMMDSNTTEAEEEATSFFEDFDVPDVGGLSAIITAPLNTIRSLLNSSCTNLTLPLPYVNENIVLPCMNSIYTEHFGAFFSIYQTIILAIIAYRCIRSIYFDIHGFTNPDDDRIEVMDL